MFYVSRFLACAALIYYTLQSLANKCLVCLIVLLMHSFNILTPQTRSLCHVSRTRSHRTGITSVMFLFNKKSGEIFSSKTKHDENTNNENRMKCKRRIFFCLKSLNEERKYEAKFKSCLPWRAERRTQYVRD